MSLPDWNDLPPEARKAAMDALDYSGVDENWQGQYAMDIYNAIKEHVPPEVFPLFQQRQEVARKSNIGLATCPFCGGDAAFGTISYTPSVVKEQGWEQGTFHSVNCVRCGAGNAGPVGHHTKDEAAWRWNRRVHDLPSCARPASPADKPRVRVQAGRRVR